ncbi:hypothetical protein AAZX31_03G036600, partial [Glycine max]
MFASSEYQDDHAPLWSFVTIKEKIGDGGGNRLWSCNFCEKVVKSSYSRVKAHLLRICGNGIATCSSSCCERNWSTYSFIHSLKRNKMDLKRAEDLVFVHSNLSVGVLEMADLSLDEPDLEAMLFLDDGNGGEENETIRV